MDINPRITLRDTLREKIQNTVMWIDLDDEISQPIIHEIKDKDDIPTGKQRIVIPAFDLYNKELGEGSGPNKITKFAYEIRICPNNSTMLKQLLCKTSEESVNDIKFISYELDSITQNNIMRDIKIQHNSFLDVVKIVPVFGIMSKYEDQIKDILSRYL